MSNHDQDETERDIAQLLEAAGAREALPEELKTRWESHFRSELAAARPARRRRLPLALAALAAGIVGILLSLERFVTDPPPAVVIQVQAVVGSAQVSDGEIPAKTAVAGRMLAPGAVVESGNDSRIALTWAGYDVRLNESTRLVLASERLELEAGEVFVSDQNRNTSVHHATVVTPFGTIRDVGTQFKVRIEQDSVSTSVRLGSVLVKSGDIEHRADAQPGSSKTLILFSDHRVQVGEDDSDWSWIYPVASPLELEGSSVLDFLRWSTTESGLELRFADEFVALAAGNTRLSGAMDIASLDPDQAVNLVLSTTRFDARRERGLLLVSRRSE